MKYVYALIIYVLSTASAYAAALEVEYPGGELNRLAEEGGLGPLQWIETFYNAAFAIVGIVAFVSLVIAGVRWMTSRKEEGISDAKDRITGVIYGLLLLGASYLLLKLINPDLVLLREPLVKPPKVEVEEGELDDDGLGGTPTEAGTTITSIQLDVPVGGIPVNEPSIFRIEAFVTQPGRYLFVINWGDDSQPQQKQVVVGSEQRRNDGSYLGVAAFEHTFRTTGSSLIGYSVTSLDDGSHRSSSGEYSIVGNEN